MNQLKYHRITSHKHKEKRITLKKTPTSLRTYKKKSQQHVSPLQHGTPSQSQRNAIRPLFPFPRHPRNIKLPHTNKQSNFSLNSQLPRSFFQQMGKK